MNIVDVQDERKTIDLEPSNHKAIASLVGKRAGELVKDGLGRGRATVKATDEVATLIHPATSGDQLSSWLGRQARLTQMSDDKRVLPLVNGVSRLLTESEADLIFGNGVARSTVLNYLLEELGGLKTGQSKMLPSCNTRAESARWQSSMTYIRKRLNWTTKTKTVKVSDNPEKWVLVVKRLT